MAQIAKYNNKLAEQDSLHLKMAYVQMHEALNELQQVFIKDNVIAHMIKQLGAMEDTLFEYAIPTKRR